MAEHDVRQFMGQHRGQGSFVGQNVSIPRLTKMVWPTVKLSSGEVSRTRQRTSG